jgi:sugar lactone lactonase YvrE
MLRTSARGRMRWDRWLIAGIVTSVLSACGGGGGGGSTPNPVTAPTIVVAPAPTAAAQGGSASFSVSAAGDAPLSYQWQRNGVDLPAQNAATLTLSPVDLVDSGASYRVVVSNAGGSVTSAAAVLSVTAATPPLITRDPLDRTASAGTTTSFDVVASGSAPLTYQWQRNGVDIAGASSASYATPPVSGADHGSVYSVRVGNAASSVTSGAAVLRVDASGRIGLFAGSLGGPGNADGQRRGARFGALSGLGFDASGALLAVHEGLVRRIDASGVVNTLAGQRIDDGITPRVDGSVTVASFSFLAGVAVDSAGNVYVSGGSAIRKISAAGVVTTLAGLIGAGGYADGTGAAARFNQPQGLAVDGAGNVYVADTGNAVVRKITSTGVVSTLAGSAGQFGSTDGVGAAARFAGGLRSIAADATGVVYVGDAGANGVIRKILPDGTVSTLAGVAGQSGGTDGNGTAARFTDPGGITLAPDGNLYVIEPFSGTVRRVTPAGGVSTLGSFAWLGYSSTLPSGIAVDATGRVHVGNSRTGTIHLMQPDGTHTLFAGNLQLPDAQVGFTSELVRPTGIVIDANGQALVAEQGGYRIRRVSAAGVAAVWAGTGFQGLNDGPALSATFYQPGPMTLDGTGNLYLIDGAAVRKVSVAGIVSTLAGKADESAQVNANGGAARFAAPNGIAVDTAGIVYVADACTIRRVALNGDVTTLAGTIGNCVSIDGTGAAAAFRFVRGLTIDATGNLTTSDDARTLRRVTSTGVVTTLAGSTAAGGLLDGTGSTARFLAPWALSTEANGDVLVADQSVLRRVTAGGVVTTIAGTPGQVGYGGASPGGVLGFVNGLTTAGGLAYVTMDAAVVRITP